MAKRSYTKKSSELEVSSEEAVSANVETQAQSETTVLTLTKDLRLKIKGPVSGTLYVFSGAGAKVPVKNEDVEGLLKKKNPNNCCSGTQQLPYFIIE